MLSALVIRDLAATIESSHQPRLAGSPLIVVCGAGQPKVLATDAARVKPGRGSATAANKPNCTAPMPSWPKREKRSIAACLTR